MKYDAAVPALRVATLNLWGRQGPWPERGQVVRRALAELAPDLLGLQEVVRYTPDADRPVDPPASCQARELADALGGHAAFGAAHDLGYGWSFGNAIVSRFPLRAVEVLRLPGAPGIEPRAAISAIVDAPFGPMVFFSTHLAWRFDEGALRMRQVVALVRAVARRQRESSFPVVLVGDFNAEAHADELRFLCGRHVHDGHSVCFVDAFAEVGSGPGATYARRNGFAAPLGEPDRRIDFVLVHGRDPRGWGRPLSSTLAFDEPAPPSAGAAPIFGSDHFGVLAELAAPEGPIA